MLHKDVLNELWLPGTIFSWKFWKITGSNGETFFFSRSKLAISLFNQKQARYAIMAQEDNQTGNGNLRSSRLERKTWVPPKIFCL